jgi:S-DNA-T family DNA segregation ATPase FtsK/SpoIIIE
VGYGRGARLIDFMAEDGVVGQYAGSQAREVLITMEEWAARNGSPALPPDPPPRKLKIHPHAAAPASVAAIEETDDEEADEESAEWDDESDDLDAADDESFDEDDDGDDR